MATHKSMRANDHSVCICIMHPLRNVGSVCTYIVHPDHKNLSVVCMYAMFRLCWHVDTKAVVIFFVWCHLVHLLLCYIHILLQPSDVLCIGNSWCDLWNEFAWTWENKSFTTMLNNGTFRCSKDHIYIHPFEWSPSNNLVYLYFPCVHLHVCSSSSCFDAVR